MANSPWQHPTPFQPFKKITALPKAALNRGLRLTCIMEQLLTTGSTVTNGIKSVPF